MSQLGETIRVGSANCRGLQEIKKRTDVLEYMKNSKVNIICLQDTHWVDSDYTYIKQIWNDELILNGNKKTLEGSLCC